MTPALTLLLPSASPSTSSPSQLLPTQSPVATTVDTAVPPATPLPSITAVAGQPSPSTSVSVDQSVVPAAAPPSGSLPLPPLRLADLIGVVKTTLSDSVYVETARLLQHHTVHMSPVQLQDMLISLHALSRNLSRTLREMMASHRAAGATNDDLLALLSRAFDHLAEDHFEL